MKRPALENESITSTHDEQQDEEATSSHDDISSMMMLISQDANDASNIEGVSSLQESPEQDVVVATTNMMACDHEPDPDAVAALIASELKSLSLEERTAAYEAVHGVAEPIHHKETPEAMAEWLLEFHEILRKNRNKTEYEKAVFLNPDYVTDPKSILMFLRADDYDVKKAALRIIKHYKHKLELFGIGKLARPITFDDLSPDDQEAAMTGFYQQLPLPDQSGRLVQMTFPHLLNFNKCKNQIRALWYFLMSAVQDDEDAQRNGLVNVVYSAGLEGEPNALPRGRLDFGLGASYLIDAIPYKVQGFHFCHDSPLLRPLLAIMQMAIGPHIRLRARTHYGSHTECKYALMTFGIPVSLIPLDDHGQFNMDGFSLMVDELREQEQRWIAKEKEEEARGRIMFPSVNDVLLGRGRPYQDFPGNLRLADIVEEHRPAYKAQSKRDKPSYADKIVRMIKDDLHGRFLKKNGSAKTGNDGYDVVQPPRGPNENDHGSTRSFFYWVEVDDDVARDKVGHSFRTMTKRRDSVSHSSGDGAPHTISDALNPQEAEDIAIPFVGLDNKQDEEEEEDDNEQIGQGVSSPSFLSRRMSLSTSAGAVPGGVIGSTATATDSSSSSPQAAPASSSSKRLKMDNTSSTSAPSTASSLEEENMENADLRLPLP